MDILVVGCLGEKGPTKRGLSWQNSKIAAAQCHNINSLDRLPLAWRPGRMDASLNGLRFGKTSDGGEMSEQVLEWEHKMINRSHQRKRRVACIEAAQRSKRVRGFKKGNRVSALPADGDATERQRVWYRHHATGTNSNAPPPSNTTSARFFPLRSSSQPAIIFSPSPPSPLLPSRTDNLSHRHHSL